MSLNNLYEKIRKNIRKYLFTTIAFTAALITIMVGSLEIYGRYTSHSDISSLNALRSKFYGKWQSNYSYSEHDGEMYYEYTTDYFRNKSFNVYGRLGYKEKENSTATSIEFKIKGSGTWQVDNSGYLTTKLDNHTLNLISYKDEGKELDVNKLKFLSKSPVTNFNKLITKNSSVDYKIIKISENNILLRTTQPDGKELNIQMERISN